MHEETHKRITTHQLNKFLIDAMQRNHPPMVMGKRLRIYYMAQVAVEPPRFILFINYKNRFTETYKKYLINQFRTQWEFKGVPLLFHLREKGSDKNRKDESLKEDWKQPSESHDLKEEAFEFPEDWDSEASFDEEHSFE